MSNRVLITGATGFVGSHLAESLLANNYRVRLLVRDPRRLKWFSPQVFDLVVGEITNEQVLAQAVKEVDVVVHCAGVTKAANPAEFFRINDVATRNLARASERAGVKRFVQCSTLAVCGPSATSQLLVESDKEMPITNYGRSKYAGEIAIREELKQTEWVILRPPAVMGPRDEQFLPLFKMMWTWRVYTEVGRAIRQYSLIGVRDLVRALTLAVSIDHGTRDSYFVAMQSPYQWHEVADAFKNLTGKKPARIVVPELCSQAIGAIGDLSMKITGKPSLLNSEKVREILASGWACDSSKIKQAWNFQCNDSLEDVVRDTLEFYRQQKWL